MALFGTLTSIIALACAIWVIYDVLVNNKRLSTGMRFVWIVCAVLFNVITAIVYYFIGRENNRVGW